MQGLHHDQPTTNCPICTSKGAAQITQGRALHARSPWRVSAGARVVRNLHRYRGEAGGERLITVHCAVHWRPGRPSLLAGLGLWCGLQNRNARFDSWVPRYPEARKLRVFGALERNPQLAMRSLSVVSGPHGSAGARSRGRLVSTGLSTERVRSGVLALGALLRGERPVVVLLPGRKVRSIRRPRGVDPDTRGGRERSSRRA